MVKICSEKYPENTKYETYFKSYEFELSDFQKYAIEAIVEGHHVLVTAHTGSGKTLPAEFALNYFVEKKKRLIYTSPIKALSNQKYSEFCRKYPHISFGLMTGDIKINPDADVLIMTTEILMNSLFLQTMDQLTNNGLDFNINIQDELAGVVFDEVHYINDVERGQTWEKTILMLPKHVQMIMLSATIDSPESFAEWAQRGDTSKEVYLASTDKRVVPLTHYGYLTINEGAIKLIKDKSIQQDIKKNTHKLIKIQSDKGVFDEDGYTTLYRMNKLFKERSIFPKKKHVLNNLALFLKNNEMLPAIGFIFSRKMVEICAMDITVSLLEDDSKIPYTVRKECDQIIRKLPNYKEYLELPEYDQLVSLLEKGVGIHHSGMIPILREIVEIMISKKYIKLLFATESFAIGLDCPIKTAIFTSIHKYDGRNERILMAHEYTQMAGRAGRRGIDKIGNVVHCNNLFSLPSKTEYAKLMNGKPQSLVSKFRISYSLILSLLKSEQTLLDDYMKFVENSMMSSKIGLELEQSRKSLDEAFASKARMEEQMKMLKTPDEILEQYMTISSTINGLKNKKRKEAERQLENMRNEYRTLVTDVGYKESFTKLLSDVEKQEEETQYFENYIQMAIKNVCDVLKNEDFICVDENTYALTENGKIASDIAEIHPLIAVTMMKNSNWFDTMSTEEIIGVLAVFTNVNVPKDDRISIPTSYNNNILKCLEFIQKEYDRFEDIEEVSNIYSGFQYFEALMYDMPDLVNGWCYCNNEQQCKYYLQNNVAEKQISAGDFTKALLKISTIAKELAVVAEKMTQMECLQKLTNVDSKILKYITTAQSLYI
jgi:superfamily II RNA helicase